jgi:hypothetical protein
MLSSEIDLLMCSTFAVQSDESARQECLTFVLPYVLLWSNRAVVHLANDDSRNDPPWRARYGRTPELRSGLVYKGTAHPACLSVMPRRSLSSFFSRQFTGAQRRMPEWCALTHEQFQQEQP